MQKNEKIENLRWMVWVALGVSVLSLLLSFSAMASVDDIRSVPDVFEMEESADSTSRTDVSLDSAEARMQLETLQARLAAEQTIDDAEQEVDELRMSFRSMYDQRTDEGRKLLMETEQELDELEVELRENSAAAIDRITRLLERLEEDIRE